MALLRLFGQQRAIWLAGLFGVGLAACQSPVVKKYPYLIKISCSDGTFSGLPTLEMRGEGVTTLDTAHLEKGQLVFRGKVTHPGVYSTFCWFENSKKTVIIELYLPADSVQATIAINQNYLPSIYQNPGLGTYDVGAYLRNVSVLSTARQQLEVASFLRTRDSLWNKYFLDKAAMAAKMNDAIGVGEKSEIDRWADSTRRVQEKFPDYLAAAAEQFVKKHPHSEINLFAMLDAGDVRVARQRLMPYYQAMPDSVRTSYFGQILAKRYGVSAAASAAH